METKSTIIRFPESVVDVSKFKAFLKKRSGKKHYLSAVMQAEECTIANSDDEAEIDLWMDTIYVALQ